MVFNSENLCVYIYIYMLNNIIKVERQAEGLELILIENGSLSLNIGHKET